TPSSRNSTPAPAIRNTMIDLRRDRDGGLLVAWHDAPDTPPWGVTATQVHRLLVSMESVHDAQQFHDTGRMQAAWLTASRGLVELLDGPERALHAQIESAEHQGVRLFVVVRALADNHDALRDHAATRMLWQLLPHSDAEEQGRRRFSAVLQLGPREPSEPQALPRAGLRILSMAFS